MSVSDTSKPGPNDKPTNPPKGANGDNRTLNRFFKYVMLLALSGLVTVLVFIAFSYYAARRDLDAELAKTNTPSFEWLYLAHRNNNALALINLETRCTERAQLAAFRMMQTKDLAEIFAASDAFEKQIADLIAVLETGTDLIDVPKAVEYVRSRTFDLANLDTYTKPLGENAAYGEFNNRLRIQRDAYLAAAAKYAATRELVEAGLYHDALFKQTAIQSLEDRLTRIAAQREDLSREQVMLAEKISLWTETLAGKVSLPYSLRQELDVEGLTEGPLPLPDWASCDALEQYFRVFGGHDLREKERTVAAAGGDELFGKAKQVDLSSVTPQEPSLWRSVSVWWSGVLVWYFTLPSVAQTLAVTLLLGALGALTLNMLRLSRAGWWASKEDPNWGEIFVGPLLGSIAAFGIFLAASAGLLLTSGSGAQSGAPLSAFFIGILGFLSGLLYDEAFGSVRRLGANYFSSGTSDDAGGEGTDGLAHFLAATGASVAAGIVAVSAAGPKLAQEDAFTLFVPADEGMSAEIVKDLMLVHFDDPPPAIVNWLNAHMAPRRLTLADLTAIAGSADANVTMKDGSKRGITISAGATMIETATVSKPDLAWKQGLVHILDKDFA